MRQFKPNEHLRASYRISVAGQAVTQNLAGRLFHLTLTDYRGFKSDLLHLDLDDPGGQFALLAKGAVNSVAFGWAASASVVACSAAWRPSP